MGLFNFLAAAFSRKPVPPTKTAGAGGVQVSGGYLVSQEKSPDLVGSRLFETYDELMANVTIVGAGVRLFLNLISKSGINVEPADESTEAAEKAELVADILDDMEQPWSRVQRRAALFWFVGFSWQEWTAKRRPDGVIGFRDVAARPQHTIERWDLDERGKVVGVEQRNPQTQEMVYLPRTKAVYVVSDTLNDSPEGLGLLRHVVESARRLERYEQLEGFGFETDLRGMPVGRAPLSELQDEVDREGGLSQAQMDARVLPIKTLTEKHIRNPKLAILLDSATYRDEGESRAPSSTYKWDVDLKSGGASAHGEVAAAITRVTHDIARVLGVEHLLLGAGPSGSRALSEDKSHTFALIVDSALTELMQVFRTDLLGPLWRMNGWDDALMPTLKAEPVRYRDVRQITGALVDLAKAGAPLEADDDAIGEVFDLLGLSRPAVELRSTPEPVEPIEDEALDQETDEVIDDIDDDEEEAA